MPSFNRVFLLSSFSSSPRWGGFFFKRERAFVPRVPDTKGFATFRLRFPSILSIWYQAKALDPWRWFCSGDVLRILPYSPRSGFGACRNSHLPTAEHQASCRELTHSSLKWQMKVLIRGQERWVATWTAKVGQVVSRKIFKISYLSSRGKWALQMIFFFVPVIFI